MKQRTEKEKKKKRHEHFCNNAAERSASGKKSTGENTNTQKKSEQSIAEL